MRSRDKLGLVSDVRAELKVIEAEWAAEVRVAVRERSAWAAVGQVEIDQPSARQTIGGFIDRKLVPLPPGVSPREAVAAWSRTPEGKMVDRLLQKANSVLVSRLPPPKTQVDLSDPWVDLMPEGPIALLGRTADLVHVMRICRTLPDAARFRACASDEATGVSAVGTTPGLTCSCIVSMGVSLAPDGVIIVAALELRSRGVGNIPRIDVTW
jgi:hypothetical protein